MSTSTTIEWTDATYSPLRARRRDTGKVGQHCERVSAGCTNCYAAAHNHRNLPNGGTGLDYLRPSRDLVETFVDERVLEQPLRWRAPRKVFVCNQTDLFADFYTDEMRDRVFAVMALAPQHTFQVLSKRPERMRAYFTRRRPRVLNDQPESETTLWHIWSACAEFGDAPWTWSSTAPSASVHGPWPLPNVWLGVSVEDQKTADERIPILLDTPAAVRFVSAEPLLGPIHIPYVFPPAIHREDGGGYRNRREPGEQIRPDWIIVGGESGPGARPCDVAWIRSIVEQCASAGVPTFVKQLGAKRGACPECEHPDDEHGFHRTEGCQHGDGSDENPICGCRKMRGEIDHQLGDPYGHHAPKDRKGGDPEEWPADLRVREFPREREAVRT
jgi:protein gp37